MSFTQGSIALRLAILFAVTLMTVLLPTYTHAAPANVVPITQVELNDGGTTVTQTASGQGGPNASSSDAPVNITKITVNDGGTSRELGIFALTGIEIKNISIPAGSRSLYFASDNGVRTDANSGSFAAAMQSILSTTDIRDYIAYEDNGNEGTVDITYQNFELNNDDFLVFQERAGNSDFSVYIVDKDGNQIAGSNSVDFVGGDMTWDTGYDAGDGTYSWDGQNQFFGVIKVSDFGVNTATTPVGGFRISSQGGDPKVFGASDDPFDPITSTPMTPDGEVCSIGVAGAGSYAVGWFHNNFGENTPQQDGYWDDHPNSHSAWDNPPNLRDYSLVSTAEDERYGSGVVGTLDVTRLWVNGADTLTLADAIAANDYVEYEFQTANFATDKYISRYINTVNTATAGFPYKFAVLVSEDANFASYVNTVQDVQREDFNNSFPKSPSNPTSFAIPETMPTSFARLKPNTTYYVRIYIYDDQSTDSRGVNFDDFNVGMADCNTVTPSSPGRAAPVVDLNGEALGGIIAGWSHHTPTSTLNADFTFADPHTPDFGTLSFSGADPSVVNTSASTAETLGSSVSRTFVGDNTVMQVSGVTQSTYTNAKGAGDYVEYTITTTGSLNADAVIDQLGYGTHQANGGANPPTEPYKFTVEVSDDNFITSDILVLDKQVAANSGTYEFLTYDVPDYSLSSSTTYTFRVYLYDDDNSDGDVIWDDFAISVVNDPTDYTNNFTQGGAAVDIADAATAVEDADDTNMTSASIVLTNAFAGDFFVINGTDTSNGSTGTINGLSYTVTESGGQITIALSGSGTKATYATTISQIQFDSSAAPIDTTDRIINVTTNDGTYGSNTAVSTIDIIATPTTPFSCGTDAYFFTSTGASDPTDRYTLDLGTNSVANSATAFHATQINAIGYNVKDNLIWGYDRGSNNVVSIDANWNVTQHTTTIPNGAYTVGDVSPDGVLHLYMNIFQYPAGGAYIARLDVDPASPTYLQRLSDLSLSGGISNGQFNLGDFAFSPIDGMLYGVNEDFASDGWSLYKIDPNTGAGTLVLADLHTYMPAGYVFDFHSSLFDNAGNFYFFGEGKTVYMMDLSDPGNPQAPVVFSAIDASTDNGDSTHCINAPIYSASYDYGDAPVSGTAPSGSGTNNYGAARHTIVSGTYLGSGDPDADAANQPDANAAGDDNDGTDDEDGVNITSVTLTQGQNATIVATVAGAGGYLQGWIDFDGNGTFDAGEQIATDYQDGGTGDTDAAAGTITFNVAVPAGAVTNQTFARFRWSTTSGLDSTTAASDGEVEDYAVTVQTGLPPFSCGTPLLYQTTTDSGQLRAFDIATETFSTTGFTPTGFHLNALGYREQDNYLYGFNLSVNPRRMVRVGSDGSTDDLGSVAGLSTLSTTAGDVHPDGTYWMASTDATSLFQIDVTTTPPTLMNTYTNVLPTKTNDFAFSADGNTMYVIVSDSADVHAVDMTGATPVRNLTPIGSFSATGNWGAQWTTPTKFYAYDNNTGALHVLDLTTGAMALLVTDNTYTRNDGTSCRAEIDFYDHSDAPLTGKSYGSASHKINASIVLGNGISAENAAYDSANADGDANDDGISIPTLTQGQTATITATVNGVGGYLQGWIDFDGSGTFDAGEQIAINAQDNITTVPGRTDDSDSVGGQISINFTVPAGAVTTNPTFARFRWSTDLNLDATTAANDGEVEDYALTIEASQNNSCTIPSDTPTAALSSSDITWNLSGNSLNFVTIQGGTTTFDQIIVPDSVAFQYANPSGSNQSVRENGTEIVNINAGATAFQAAMITAVSSANLAHYVQHDNSITNTDYNEYFFSEPVTAASNRYIIITERNGNNSMSADARNANGDIIGSAIPATAGQYINTGASAIDYGQPVMAFVYPLTALAPSGVNIHSIRLTQTGASSGGSDGGDGKIFIIVDSDTYCNSSGPGSNPTLDYSDTPTDGGTAPDGSSTLAYGEATHVVTGGIQLGSTITDETSAVVDADNPSDDGVATFSALTTTDSSYSVDVTATNTTGSAATLHGWIDVDGNGTFDADEHTNVTVPDGTNAGMVALNWANLPSDAIAADTFIRLRLTTDALTNTDAANAANDGEVEDYQVSIDPISCQAVPMTAIGSAYSNGDNEYILTDDVNNQAGFLWSNEKIDLSQPFDFQLAVYLGTNVGIDSGTGLDSGADGLSFILQSDSRGVAAQGMIGGGMGVDGASNLSAFGVTDQTVMPSVTVEFDTFDNTPFSGTGDIAADHTGIYLNGDVYIPDASNTLLAATPVGTGGEIEDGAYHIARFVWNPSTQTLTYYFDGTQITSTNYNLQTYFGTQYVTFGFSAATGASKNEHKACWINPPVTVEPTQTLSGVVFEDSNADDTPAAAEARYANVTVTLYDWNDANTDGAVLDSELSNPRTTQTAADGSYSFTELLPGSYAVQSDNTATALGSAVFAGADNPTGAIITSSDLVRDFPYEPPFRPELPKAQCQAQIYGWLDTYSPNPASTSEATPDYDIEVGGYALNAQGIPARPVSDLPDLDELQPIGYNIPELDTTNSDGQSEGIWVITRHEGTAGTTGSLTFTSSGDVEHSVIAILDISGNVLARYPSLPAVSVRQTTANVTLNFTWPANGIVYAHNWYEDYSQFSSAAYPTSCFNVSGRVYNDSNADGINDASETGITELPVVLLDTVNNTCVSTRTDGDGNYTFFGVMPGNYQVYEASQETVPTPQSCDPAQARDPSGYLSTTSNVSTAFAVTNAPVTDIDFGDVTLPAFVADNTGDVLPGNVTFYAHTFTPPTSGSVNFTLSANDPAGWSSVLYHDADCSGDLNGTEADAELTAALATTAGTDICLVHKVFAPANSSMDQQSLISITADFTYGNGTTLAANQSLLNEDITTVSGNPVSGEGKLELIKTVQNLTQGSAETMTQNTALPGDTLQYRIIYRNTGTGAITDLDVSDTVPPFTLLDAGSVVCETTPATLNCVPNAANDPAISWGFSGQLEAGVQGVVSYRVVVE